MAIYGVHIPIKSTDNVSEEDIHVYTDKDAAFKVLRTYKEARLKVFKNHAEAQKFSEFGLDASSINTSGLKSPSSSPSAEKIPYRAPKSQELVLFRKSIENGSLEIVKTTIWDNPRYLIGSGDTPSILKEGTRYNAIHVAALHNRAKICELILETISKPHFIQLLHGKKNFKTCQDVSNILLEMYLNMPEKGRSDTPLHLAVKYGALEVVEVLTSYLQCKMTKNLDGLYPRDVICSRAKIQTNQLYESISSLLQERFYVPVIRSIDSSTPPIIGEPFTPQNPPILKTDPLSPEMEIQAYAGPMDKEQAQVFRKRWKTPPRLINSSSHSVRGSPLCSPMKSSSSHQGNSFISPIKLYKCTPQKEIISNEKQHHSSTPINHQITRNLFSNKSSDSLLDEEKNITKLNGTNFLKRFNSFELNENGNYEAKKYDDIPTTITTQTGTNEIDKNSNSIDLSEISSSTTLSNENFTNYRERILLSSTSTIFDDDDQSNSTILNSSLTFNSQNSNSLLENFDVFDSPSFKERNLKITDTEKGLEIIGRGLAREHNVGWKEYWSFLGSFVNFNTSDGLEQLESYLKKKSIKDEKLIKDNLLIQLPKYDSNHKIENVLNKLCTAFDDLTVTEDISEEDGKVSLKLTSLSSVGAQKKHGGDHLELLNDNINIGNSHSQGIQTYLCVEKSLQIFAQRIYKLLMKNNLDIIIINERLEIELNRLRSLIYSYKDDERFKNVNFNCAHSRFSNLIVAYIKKENLENVTFIKKIKYYFEEIILLNLRLPNDDETIKNRLSLSDITCLSKFLLENLNKIDKIIAPETLITEKECYDSWLTERNCLCEWKNLSKRTVKPRNNLSTTTKLINDNEKNLLNKIPTSDLWSFRNTNLIPISDVDDEVEGEELFWSGSDDDNDSDSDSRNDVYYTPPESPSEFNDLNLMSSDSENSLTTEYSNYILGDEPTKTDVNVLNSIHVKNIDSFVFPFVYKWKMAILKFPTEERESFPSPSVIVKSHINLCSTETTSPAVVRKLFSKSYTEPKHLTINTATIQTGIMENFTTKAINVNNNNVNNNNNSTNQTFINNNLLYQRSKTIERSRSDPPTTFMN